MAKVVKKTQQQSFFLKGNLLDNFQTWKKNRRFYLVLLVIGLLLIFAFKRSWLIAATVNNEPITNLQLQTKLNQQFREQVISQLVNEKLLDQEAVKNQIRVSEEDLNQKIKELENNVGGTQALDSLLAQQGQDRQALKQQLRIQVIIEKLYNKDATVSAQEVDDYITQNKENLRASDSAGQKKEAEDLLKQQKLGQIFSEKFQVLKNMANIKIF
ncbi:MAG: SurA N-terminal domain-containing protein [Candidatus Daviesbacteria bacterium]|nr:MAG: SurA N-terminal domain-containing protein [Candidatus Daviesbacteria bacterium]